jgi:hypothetical protein
MKQTVFLFHTSTAALRAEKLLKRAGLVVKLVPTPRQLSSDCGIALEIASGQAPEGLARITQAGIEATLHETGPQS